MRQQRGEICSRLMLKAADGTVQLQASNVHQQQLRHRRTVKRALQIRDSRELLLLRMLRALSTLQQMTMPSTSGAAGCGGSTSESSIPAHSVLETCINLK